MDVAALCTKAAELADAHEDDAVEQLLAVVATELAADREQRIAVQLALADAFRAKFDARWVHRAIAAARDALADGDARWIDVTIAYIVALIDDFERERAAEVFAELDARTRDDRALAVAVRMRIARGLVSAYEYEAAIEHLRVAEQLATTDDERIDAGLLLGEALAHENEDDAAADVLGRCVPLADARARMSAATNEHRDIAARGHLALGRHDVEPHARIALELAIDPALRREAAHALADVLATRGELVAAEAILAQHAGPRSGLHDEIRRKLGTLPDEPPPEELVDPPLGDSAALAAFAVQRDLAPLGLARYAEPRGLAPDLVAFFTPPGGAADLAAALRARRPATPELMREWSHGEVRSEADLDSEKIFGPIRSYFCACGRYRGNRYIGFVCERCLVEVITNRTRDERAGHISLAEPIVHPWYAYAAELVFDLGPKALRELRGDALTDRFYEVDFTRIELELEDMIERTRSEAKQRVLKARLAIIAAMNASGTRPRDLYLDLVPVLPPDAELPGVDRAKVRAAYVRLVHGDEPNRAVAALLRCFEP